MNEKTSKVSSRISPFKILRAVAIGLACYLLIAYLPILLMYPDRFRLNRASGDPVEPVYHDKDGRRINKAEFDLLTGYDLAKANGAATHAECRRAYRGLVVTGCDKYVTEQKHIPPPIRQGNWDSGKTTAECRAEVNAYWEAVIQDEREKGGDRAANSWSRRDWMPELQECQNYDNVRIAKVVYAPAARLNELLRKLESGGSVTDQEKATVRQDMVQVTGFPDHPAKKEYFDNVDRFLLLADGKAQPRVEQPLQLSCEEFRRKIEELDGAEKHDVDELSGLKRGTVITDGAKWDALNRSRNNRQWERRRYTDGAFQAKCYSASLEN